MNGKLKILSGILVVALVAAVAALVTLRRDAGPGAEPRDGAPDAVAEGSMADRRTRPADSAAVVASEQIAARRPDAGEARKPGDVPGVARPPRARRDTETVSDTVAERRRVEAERIAAGGNGVERVPVPAGRARTEGEGDTESDAPGVGGIARRAGVESGTETVSPETPVTDEGTVADTPEVPPGWVEPEVAREIFEETAARNEEAQQRREEQRQQEPEQIVPAVSVMRRDTLSEEGEMTVAFTITRDSERSDMISGLVLSQRIPPGWGVEEANPPMTSFDQRTRVAKWLFIGQPVPEGQVVYRSAPVRENAAIEDWALSQSWYTYREPGRADALSFSTETR